MAGDWIKMRAGLFTHPKVVRMASALKADTLRTVGGLMSVWCLFDAHSVDGQLDGYTPEALDAHLRWEGFSDAMIKVGWLAWDGDEGLLLPEFDTHNGQSAKRRAQDADRKREVRKVSAPEADKKRTREEKRREEKKPPKAPQGALEVPDWIPVEPWEEFVAMRMAKGQRSPFTVGAAKGVIAKLDALRAAGTDLAAVLRQSTVNGWADVYELKPQDTRQGSAPAAKGPDPELERIKAHKGAPIPENIRAQMDALKGKVLQ